VRVAIGIRTACEKADAYCERVDEQFYQESILQRVYNQIAKADLIVADMTERNPNVFYEVGYAHALGKDVILITQKIEDIPFDLKHYPHIAYGGGIASLIDPLERRIRWGIEQQDFGQSPIEPPTLKFFIGGVEIRDDIEIPVEVARPGEAGHTSLSIDIHNIGTRVVEVDEATLAIVVGKNTRARGGVNPVRLPEGNLHCDLSAVGRILPLAWRSAVLDIWLDPVTVDENQDQDDPYAYMQFQQEKDLPIQFIHYQEHGVRSFTLSLKLKVS